MHEAEWAKWEWAKWEWLSGNLLLSENALSGNALASGLRHLREETVVRPWHATQDGRLFSPAPRSGDLAGIRRCERHVAGDMFHETADTGQGLAASPCAGLSLASLGGTACMYA